MTSGSSTQRDQTAALFSNRNHIILLGVINITPDSFSDGGRFFDADRAVEHALQLVADGADIIDIGGESTRPGADAISIDEEIRRVVPAISRLADQTTALISVDTHREPVASAALAAGAAIVNDVSGLTGDSKMARVVAEHNAGLILMHRRGDPKTMQLDTQYDNLVEEVVGFLSDAIARAEAAGIDPVKIMIDPGIGFGKDLAGNVEIVQSIASFSKLGKPVLIGASRKSFIGQITGADVGNRLSGSIAAAVAAVLYGAAAVRVHDVKETRQAVDVAIRLRQVR